MTATLEEAVSAQRPRGEGRAQRSLRILASVPFVKVGPGSEKAPAWFVIPVMEGWVKWRWVSGSGADAVYELEGEAR